MNFIFQKEIIGEEQRLVLSISEGMELDQFALHMMNHNDIDYLVPVQLAQYNAMNYIQYDIVGLNTLSSKVSSTLKKSEVIQILNSIICAFEEVDAYMLSDKSLFLDLNYIFIDNKNKCNFLYVPLLQEVSNDKILFLQHLVEHIQPDYTEKDPYIFNILNAFSRGAINKISDLKEILRKNSSNLLPMNKESEQIEEKDCVNSQSTKTEKKLETEGNGVIEQKVEAKVSKGTAPVLNIPGKASVPLNIPEPLEAKKVENKEKEDKKRPGIRLFGKKNTGKKEAEKKNNIQVPAYENTSSGRMNANENMYESYEQTVMIQRTQTMEESSDVTICLNTLNPIAELERRRTGERIRIMSVNAVLGSGSGVDCYIANNKAISRSHAMISMQNGRYYIADNNSSNGTWVNGNRLLPGNNVEIYNNTLIKLADEEFIFNL